MKLSILGMNKTLTYKPWRLLSIALVSSLVLTVTLLLAVLGLEISTVMDLTHISLQTGGIILLIVMIVASFISLVSTIRTLKLSLSGGNRTYTAHSRNYD